MIDNPLSENNHLMADGQLTIIIYLNVIIAQLLENYLLMTVSSNVRCSLNELTCWKYIFISVMMDTKLTYNFKCFSSMQIQLRCQCDSEVSLDSSTDSHLNKVLVLLVYHLKISENQVSLFSDTNKQ